MKRILFFFIAFVTIFQTASAYYSFYANAPTGQRIYYKIMGENVSVCCPGELIPFSPWGGYTKPTGNLTIPSSVTYNGTTYSVTEIGQDAFYGCVGLSSVIIPNTVTLIRLDAFLDCSGLTSVTIGNSVTTIGIGAFMNCSNLTSLTIPNSVTQINNRAFMNCTGLTSLTIGNSVTIICEDAFRKCTSLTSLTIPNSVLTIEQCSFDSCINLTTVNIGNSVNHIVNNPFKYCNNLNTIVVNSGNNYYDSRNNCNAIIKTATNELVTGCKNTAIPNSVTSIALQSFRGCNGLHSLTIPSSVSSIGTRAFSRCSNLTEITCLATEAPSLGWAAFDEVPSTIPVYIPCGSMPSYDSIWTYFPNQIERPWFSLNVTSNNNSMGLAQVLSGPTCSDSMATILATAYTGYHFTNWGDGNTDNPRQIAVTHDIELTALFDISTFSVVVISNDSTQGSVAGGGEFVYQSLCTIEATANNGYHFHHWSTGSWSNPFTFMVTHNTTNIAYFEADSGTEVGEFNLNNISIYTRGNRIVVEGTTDEVRVFDMTGRHIRNEALPTGFYLVKVGDYLTRKVVVIQ